MQKHTFICHGCRVFERQHAAGLSSCALRLHISGTLVSDVQPSICHSSSGRTGTDLQWIFWFLVGVRLRASHANDQSRLNCRVDSAHLEMRGSSRCTCPRHDRSHTKMTCQIRQSSPAGVPQAAAATAQNDCWHQTLACPGRRSEWWLCTIADWACKHQQLIKPSRMACRDTRCIAVADTAPSHW